MIIYFILILSNHFSIYHRIGKQFILYPSKCQENSSCFENMMNFIIYFELSIRISGIVFVMKF